MNNWVFLVVAALSAVDVFCSHYHGPTVLPQVLHNGYLADNHDVAAAKSAHLATLTHQSHGYVDNHNSHDSDYSHTGDLRYHGPTAIPHVLHDGHIADTHEVAAAKGEHLALVSKAKFNSHAEDFSGRHTAGSHEYSRHGDLRYRGPTAVPHVLHDGHIADTHQVATAKAKYLDLVSKAKSNSHIGDFRGVYTAENQGYSGHGDSRYHGPTAIPHVPHQGHIANTHEVAAVKAAHFAAIPQAKAHVGHGYNSGSSLYGLPHQSSYNGPIFKPVVLKSGYLADTHDVAAAKQRHLHALYSRHSGHHYYTY